MAFERFVPAPPAPTSTAPCSATSRRTNSCRYWRQHTGHAIGLRNHEAPFLDIGDHTRSSRAWCSRSSPASTHASRRLPPLRHGPRHRGRRSRSSPTTRATSRATLQQIPRRLIPPAREAGRLKAAPTRTCPGWSYRDPRLSNSVGAGFHPARGPGSPAQQLDGRADAVRERRRGIGRRPAPARRPRATLRERERLLDPGDLARDVRAAPLDRRRRPRTSTRRHRGSCNVRTLARPPARRRTRGRRRARSRTARRPP